ncbi:MAG: hypothetical protein NVS9B3_12660 [Gemmatimonadaceae bacterium]
MMPPFTKPQGAAATPLGGTRAAPASAPPFVPPRQYGPPPSPPRPAAPAVPVLLPPDSAHRESVPLSKPTPTAVPVFLDDDEPEASPPSPVATDDVELPWLTVDDDEPAPRSAETVEARAEGTAEHEAAGKAAAERDVADTPLYTTIVTPVSTPVGLAPPTSDAASGEGREVAVSQQDIVTTEHARYVAAKEPSELPAWLDEEPELGDDVTGTGHDGVASALEDVAARVRRGEIRVVADDGPISEATALAVTLAALLSRER